MPLPRLFIPSQTVTETVTVNEDWITVPTTDNTGNYTGPTTTTTWDYSYVPPPDVMALLMTILVVAIVLMVFWWWLDRQRRIERKDIRPSVSDLSSDTLSLNRAAIVQLLPYIPVLVGLTPTLMLAESNAPLAFAILVALSSLPALMYFYLKTKSLENNKGKVNMSGYLRTKEGRRFAYFWRNVEFKTERHLNKDELLLIDQAKVAKVASTEVPVYDIDPNIKPSDTDEEKKEKKEKVKKKKKDQQKEYLARGPVIEYEPEVWTSDEVSKTHAIPVRIGDRYDAYLMSLNNHTEWEFIDGEDYDYYGYHDVHVTGPELREIATMHRVVEVGNGVYRDVYVPVFLVMYDDKMSADKLKDNPAIDATRDVALAGLVKSIGVEERTTAGELNSITEQVMVLENEDKDLDDLSQTIARKKALDFINAEKRLTMFDVGTLGTVSVLTAIVFGVILFLLGFSLGGG